MSLSRGELRKIDAYWRAANDLSIGQNYLFNNPLLTEPLKAEHIKPRLLGHWGTTPGLNFIYAHCNRAIKRDDLNMIYLAVVSSGRLMEEFTLRRIMTPAKKQAAAKIGRPTKQDIS